MNEPPRSYYGRPVLKEPVWKPLIPLYFFTGGLAGASSSLALAARLSGHRTLARSAAVTSLAAVATSPPLLIADLGRPARFANMLRVAKPTSPMSVGSWVLAVFGPAAGLAGLSQLTGRFPHAGRAGGVVAGALGPVMATYTAVLLADTAVPAWHEARRHLPFLFTASAGASAAGLAMATTPSHDAGPARRLAAGCGFGELLAARAMERHLGELAQPYQVGSAARLARAGRLLTAAGALLALPARRRMPAMATGALLTAGGLLTRFSVFRAGIESSADPAATIGPQRQRLTAARSDAVMQTARLAPR